VPKRQYTWTLGRLRLCLARGDIFAIPAEAIVNSEQTDFILAGGGPSISAQISRRWGQSVQDQLDAQTGGETLPLGTVLETDAPPFRCAFHAGFHHPDMWLDPDSPDSDQTEHLRVVRRCVRRVLERAAHLELGSVAFPLIGTGVFGLDPKVLAYEFFDEIILFATESELPRDLSVWLVIHDSSLFDAVVEAGVQAWVDRTSACHDWQHLHLGISYLDEFENRLARASDLHWRAFLVTQYTELLTAFFHAVLANALMPPVSYTVLEPDRLISFGTLRSEAVGLAKRMEGSAGTAWSRFIADILLRRAQCLERINQDRNNIAHTRAFRPLQEILADLVQLVCLEDWCNLASKEPLPKLVGLAPWICLQSPGSRIPTENEAKYVGLLEEWSHKQLTYVNPNTGTEFKVPAA